MSIGSVGSTDFNFALFDKPGKAEAQGTSTFFSSLALRIADFKSQALGSLMGSVADTDTGSACRLDAPRGAQGGATDPLSALAGGSGADGLSATGRNASLFDPESAYRMMSVINEADVTWKAQFSELSQMQSWLATLAQDARCLGGIDASTGNAGICTRLVDFAGRYNDWIERFDADMAQGGALAGTQAAQVSRFELEASVRNIFNGAASGLHGLGDLGFSIDPVTKMAVVDSVKLNAMLAANKAGAVDALQSFSANFARAAELLDSDGNFIPNRLNNLRRAIDFIDDNTPALQAEFGRGDAARPSARVAQALAAYQQAHAI